MNKTERFREIAAKHTDEWEDSVNTWYETPPGEIEVDGYRITVLESTNFNVDATYGGSPDTEDWWVIVSFGNELYRLTGLYDSWSGTEWNDWQRVEKRPVTTYEYVEVDNDH